jgi:hypothetical protein
MRKLCDIDNDEHRAYAAAQLLTYVVRDIEPARSDMLTVEYADMPELIAASTVHYAVDEFLERGYRDLIVNNLNNPDEHDAAATALWPLPAQAFVDKEPVIGTVIRTAHEILQLEKSHQVMVLIALLYKLSQYVGVTGLNPHDTGEAIEKLRDARARCEHALTSNGIDLKAVYAMNTMPPESDVLSHAAPSPASSMTSSMPSSLTFPLPKRKASPASPTVQDIYIVDGSPSPPSVSRKRSALLQLPLPVSPASSPKRRPSLRDIYHHTSPSPRVLSPTRSASASAVTSMETSGSTAQWFIYTAGSRSCSHQDLQPSVCHAMDAILRSMLLAQ